MNQNINSVTLGKHTFKFAITSRFARLLQQKEGIDFVTQFTSELMKESIISEVNGQNIGLLKTETLLRWFGYACLAANYPNESNFSEDLYYEIADEIGLNKAYTDLYKAFIEAYAFASGFGMTKNESANNESVDSSEKK